MLMFASRGFRLASLFAMVVMALSMVSVDQAEARRGGSFGSRGTRTFQTAPATPTSPNITAPVQRSMTPGQTTAAPRPGAQTAQPRSMFGGFGGSLLSGIMLGGLFGLFLGHGFGGMAGLFGLLVQGALIFFVIRFVVGMLSRNSRQPAAAGAGMNYSSGSGPSPLGGLGGGRGSGPSRAARGNPDELGVSGADLDRFEDMLREVQFAFGREDYSALRQLTTPEMMSYLSEELGENASRGLKNEVSEVKLLKGDVAESWREGNEDYATAAMHYSSIDVTRDRESGRIMDGDAEVATDTTELWTFVRPRGGDWKHSAIQQA
jgi:predicted lipid-binding transport protein (Tim44 family)